MYKDNSVHDDTAYIVVFEEKKYTIEEAVDWIIEKTGIFLKYSYYADARFDYITIHPIIGKLICKMNPSVNSYLQEDDWTEADEWQIEDNYIKAGRLFLRYRDIVGCERKGRGKVNDTGYFKQGYKRKQYTKRCTSFE